MLERRVYRKVNMDALSTELRGHDALQGTYYKAFERFIII
jgi:hypothetical protein